MNEKMSIFHLCTQSTPVVLGQLEILQVHLTLERTEGRERYMFPRKTFGFFRNDFASQPLLFSSFRSFFRRILEKFGLRRLPDMASR